MWNEWRRTLIDSLYLRVREAIEQGGARPATPGVGAIVAAADTGDVDRRDIEEHVAAMPDDYLGETMPWEILWHLEVIKALDDVALISIDPDDPGRVLVVGADRSGFLLAVTRAFTANGVGIRDARLRTRSDGIALDTFHVVTDRTGEAVPESRWAVIGADLQRSLGAGGDLRPAIRERVKAYRRADDSAGAVEVRTWVADRRTVVEVRAPDRIGLLADIVEALHGDGLDIHLARIDTMGGVARDLFYVRRIGGIPIRDELELATLRGRIEDKLRG
jgi:[protein-PII] uridylyltransferase